MIGALAILLGLMIGFSEPTGHVSLTFALVSHLLKIIHVSVVIIVLGLALCIVVLESFDAEWIL